MDNLISDRFLRREVRPKFNGGQHKYQHRQRFFEFYRSRGSFWFRILGYGLHGKNLAIHRMHFSERNGYTKHFYLFGWLFSWLKPRRRIEQRQIGQQIGRQTGYTVEIS